MQIRKCLHNAIETYDNYLIIFPSIDDINYSTIYFSTDKRDWPLRKVHDFKMVGLDVEIVRFSIDYKSSQRTIVQTFGDLGVSMKVIEKIVDSAVL